MNIKILKTINERNFMGIPVSRKQEIWVNSTLIKVYLERKRKYFSEPDYTCESSPGYFSAKNKKGDYSISYQLQGRL